MVALEKKWISRAEVVTIDLPKPSGPHGDRIDVDVQEIERKGANVHVLVRDGRVDVEGWITTRDLASPSRSALFGSLLGALVTPKVLDIVRETPVFVRQGERVLRVGTAKAGVTLTCASKNGAREGETNVTSTDADDTASSGLGRLGFR